MWMNFSWYSFASSIWNLLLLFYFPLRTFEREFKETASWFYRRILKMDKRQIWNSIIKRTHAPQHFNFYIKLLTSYPLFLSFEIYELGFYQPNCHKVVQFAVVTICCDNWNQASFFYQPPAAITPNYHLIVLL
jgi:hypothetical protein